MNYVTGSGRIFQQQHGNGKTRHESHESAPESLSRTFISNVHFCFPAPDVCAAFVHITSPDATNDTKLQKIKGAQQPIRELQERKMKYHLRAGAG